MDRYTDIKTFEYSRIKLAERQGKSSYINPCQLNSPFTYGDGKIIAAQGPLDLSNQSENTTGDFWRMIAEYKVTMIVTTCKLEEGGRPKCAKFWPEQEDDQAFAKILNVDGMTVV